MPATDLLEAMGKYNGELVNAGIMLSGEGIKPSSQGKRVAFDGYFPNIFSYQHIMPKIISPAGIHLNGATGGSSDSY